MKLIIVLFSLLMFVVACGPSSPDKKSTRKIKSQQTLELPSPLETATKFLKAYKDKNLADIKPLLMPALAMNFSQDSFRDKIVQKLINWNGSASEFRYTHGDGGILAAAIPYAGQGTDTISLLVLSYYGKKWRTGMTETFIEVKKEVYETFFDKLHNENELEAALPGTWKCSYHIFNNKLENPNVSYTFNPDGSVIKNSKGVIIKGEYKIKDYTVVLKNLKRDDGKWSPQKETLILKDPNTLVMLNPMVAAKFVK